MFPNLKAEMARTSITSKDISRYLGKASSWLESRLQGIAKLPVEDAIKIKQKFFPYARYEYLYADEPVLNDTDQRGA